MIDSAAMLGRKSFRLVNRSTVALEPGDNLHPARAGVAVVMMGFLPFANEAVFVARSEGHTSELQSLMRISYAVFCLQKKMNMYFVCSSALVNHNVHN